MKIDVRVHQHLVGFFLQKNPESVQLKGCITLYGSFGYVHSQGRASAARDCEDSHSVASGSLLRNYHLELLYRAVCQTYHYFPPCVGPGESGETYFLYTTIYSCFRNCFFLSLKTQDASLGIIFLERFEKHSNLVPDIVPGPAKITQEFFFRAPCSHGILDRPV